MSGIKFSVQTGSRGSVPLKTVVLLLLMVWAFSPGMATRAGVCTLEFIGDMGSNWEGREG